MASQISWIRGGSLWSPEGFRSGTDLRLEEGRIAALDSGEKSARSKSGPSLDATGGYVIPGLIDLQVNGALGWSFQSQHRGHFDEILRYHLSAGTTTLLPTLVTAPEASLLESLTILAGYMEQRPPASLPGIHLEGPFLAPEKCGAHDSDALLDPKPELSQRFLNAAGDRLALFTLAPELPGAGSVIELMAGKGVIVSAGHTAATYAQMRTAMDAGISFVTHAGNASDWPHRAPGELGFMASEPGIVGTLLAHPSLACGIIMDGFHFHPALLPPLVTLKRPDRVILVSDASTVAGSPPGEYESGGLQVTVRPEGFATSGRGGGWLAGSIITLMDAVRRAVKLAGIGLHQAVWMASLAPARLLDIAPRKGLLQTGSDADLLVLNSDLSLRHVVIGGRSDC